MNYSNFRTIFVFILCALVLSACGGTSSSTTPQSEAQPVDDTSVETPDDQSEVEDSDVDSVATGSNTSIINNRPVTVLVMEGQPLQSPPGRELVVLGDFDINADGEYVITGIYQGISEQINGVWSGALGEAPQIILEQGSVIFIDSAEVVFNGADGAYVGPLGEIILSVKLAGEPSIRALAMKEPGAEKFSVLVTGGDTVPGYSEPHVLGAILARKFSDAGVAFVSSTEVDSSFLYGLWTLQNGEIKAVAPGKTALVPSDGPTYPGKDCLLYYAGTNAFAITNEGDVIFEAKTSAPSNTGICPDDAIIRFDGQKYIEVVATQALVPGAQGSWFSSLELSGITADGAVLVNAVIQNSEPVRNRVWSQWHFPKDGEPNLLMIDAERVEGAVPTASLATRTAAVRIGTDLRFAAKAQLGDSNALFHGPHRQGQPHTNLALPGAAAMQLVAVNDEEILVADSSVYIFEEIGEPELPISGGMVFKAEVTPPGGALPERVLWSVQDDGSLERLLAASDTLQYNGASVLVGSAGFGPSAVSQWRFYTTAANDIVFEASDGRSLRILHLPLTP